MQSRYKFYFFERFLKFYLESGIVEVAKVSFRIRASFYDLFVNNTGTGTVGIEFYYFTSLYKLIVLLRGANVKYFESF